MAKLTKRQKQILAIVGLVIVIGLFAPGLFTWNPESGTYIPSGPSLPGECDQPGLNPAGCPPVGAKCYDGQGNPVPCIASAQPLAVFGIQEGIYYISFTATLTNNGGVTLDSATIQTATNGVKVYDGDIYNTMKNGGTAPPVAGSIPTCTANPSGCAWTWVSTTQPCDSGEVLLGGKCLIPLNATFPSNYQANCADVTGCQFGIKASGKYTYAGTQRDVTADRVYKTYVIKPDPTASFTLEITSAGQ